MESSSLNNLTTVKLKSLHNREIGYAELFSGRRIVIFSTPQPVNTFAWEHLKKFTDLYNSIIYNKIDEVYAVSSEAMVIPFVQRHSAVVKPLHDCNKDFLTFMQQSINSSISLNELNCFWQYTVIVNDGKIEKLFNNPIKENMTLKIYLNPKYHFRGVDANTVLEYVETAPVDTKR